MHSLQYPALVFTLLAWLSLGANPASAESAFIPEPLASDFNGDGLQDDISSHTSDSGSAYLVQVFISGSRASSLLEAGVFPQPGLRLIATDIDRDGDPDIVLTGLSKLPIAVWANDGKGRFSRESHRFFPLGEDMRRAYCLPAARPNLGDATFGDPTTLPPVLRSSLQKPTEGRAPFAEAGIIPKLISLRHASLRGPPCSPLV